jgi:hypothetical protein
MRFVFTTLLLVVLILLAVAVAIFLLSLGFVGMGWLLSRLLPLSLFEASVIALLSGFGLAHVISQIVSIPTGSAYDEDWEDEEDWDEEDWDEEWEEDELLSWEKEVRRDAAQGSARGGFGIRHGGEFHSGDVCSHRPML